MGDVEIEVISANIFVTEKELPKISHPHYPLPTHYWLLIILNNDLCYLGLNESSSIGLPALFLIGGRRIQRMKLALRLFLFLIQRKVKTVPKIQFFWVFNLLISLDKTCHHIEN